MRRFLTIFAVTLVALICAAEVRMRISAANAPCGGELALKSGTRLESEETNSPEGALASAEARLANDGWKVTFRTHDALVAVRRGRLAAAQLTSRGGKYFVTIVKQ